MIVTPPDPAPAPETPDPLAELRAEVKAAHADAIRAKSAVKRLTDHQDAIDALLAQIPAPPD